LTNIANLAANLAALPVTVVAADKDLAEDAAIFKYDFKFRLSTPLQDRWRCTRTRTG
jgi:hypothetical protein